MTTPEPLTCGELMAAGACCEARGSVDLARRLYALGNALGAHLTESTREDGLDA